MECREEGADGNLNFLYISYCPMENTTQTPDWYFTSEHAELTSAGVREFETEHLSSDSPMIVVEGRNHQSDSSSKDDEYGEVIKCHAISPDAGGIITKQGNDNLDESGSLYPLDGEGTYAPVVPHETDIVSWIPGSVGSGAQGLNRLITAVSFTALHERDRSIGIILPQKEAAIVKRYACLPPNCFVQAV